MAELYINGEKVETAAIETEIDRLRPSYQQVFQDQPAQQQEQQLAEWAKENVIESTLFRQAAVKAFPAITDDEIQAALNGLLENENEMGPIHQQMAAGDEVQKHLQDSIAAQLRQEKLSRQVTDDVPAPTDKAVQKYYEANLAERFTIPEMVRAAHIVKHPGPDTTPEEMRAQMQAILDKLNSGTPFEELARENSDCPDQAGDLGFFPRGQMVPVFEEVVFNLAPGSRSDIFETEFGLHIAKVYETRPATPCPLEQVREVIIRDLSQQAKEKAIEKFLDAQKEKAVIEQR